MMNWLQDRFLSLIAFSIFAAVLYHGLTVPLFEPDKWRYIWTGAIGILGVVIGSRFS